MKVWKNTPTLDNYLLDIEFTDKKEEANVLLIGAKKFDIDEFPNAKYVFRVGVGDDNIDYNKLNSRGIFVYFPSDETKECIYGSVANFTEYLIYRAIYDNTYNVEKWNKGNRNHTPKILIIGFRGNIGSRIYLTLACNVGEVWAYDEADRIDKNYLKKCIKECDIISLNIPLNKKTNNLFDEKMLSLMKDGSWLINTSRAQIVNEEALMKELRSGRLRAAFDVFWREPYKVPDDISKENFIVTPHCAGTTKKILELMARDFKSMLEKV